MSRSLISRCYFYLFSVCVDLEIDVGAFARRALSSPCKCTGASLSDHTHINLLGGGSYFLFPYILSYLLRIIIRIVSA
jgi:hypothetical protein